MDAGEDLAARQLAAVADVLLPWLRADADADTPRAVALPASAETVLAATDAFDSGDELQCALRKLLARAEVARTAAHLALTSKDVCETLRARYGDLLDAPGAACCAHAAAMQSIVRKVADSKVCSDEELNDCLLSLCSRPSEFVEPAALDDDEDAFQAALLGAHVSSPLMKAAADEDAEGVCARLEALPLDTPPRGCFDKAWKQIADNLDDYARRNPEMSIAQPTMSALTGGGFFASPMMRGAILGEFPDAEIQVDPCLLDVLRMPDDV